MADYKAIMIFFMLFSAGLALYIGSQGLSIFRSSRFETERIGQKPLNCVDYFYSVDNISYDGYTLQFDIANNAVTGREIEKLIVEGVEKKSDEFLNFVPGLKKHVIIGNIRVVGRFRVYPDGCDVYAKEFRVEG